MGRRAEKGRRLNPTAVPVFLRRRVDGEAGLRRFRPIILTTLTTFGGLTPIILETSRQAYRLIPMAISLGIVFATAIILVLVPGPGGRGAESTRAPVLVAAAPPHGRGCVRTGGRRAGLAER